MYRFAPMKLKLYQDCLLAHIGYRITSTGTELPCQCRFSKEMFEKGLPWLATTALQLMKVDRTNSGPLTIGLFPSKCWQQ